MCNRYITYRKDRKQSSIPNKKGGGVLIAVNSNIKSNEYKNIIKMKDLESVCVIIPTPFGNIYIYAVYIQHGWNIDVDRAHIDAISDLKSTMDFGDILIVCGYFSLSGIKWDENDFGFDYIPIIGESHSIAADLYREVIDSLIDLDPIENVWAILKARLKGKPFRNLELFGAFLKHQ